MKTYPQYVIFSANPVKIYPEKNRHEKITAVLTFFNFKILSTQCFCTTYNFQDFAGNGCLSGFVIF